MTEEMIVQLDEIAKLVFRFNVVLILPTSELTVRIGLTHSVSYRLI